jgi:hypothetical protein
MSILLINGSYRALINGSYRAKGAQPDGDSIHFVPENPGEWNLVGGNTPAKRSASGAAQLPRDGIAALETTRKHGTRLHQPLPLAHVPPTTC